MILGVNIDHIATLRQARAGTEPSLLEAALIAQNSGADLITVHLREDRRHIQDKDVLELKKLLKIPLNLEMALADEIIQYAINIKPYKVTIVPENRREITTEGGLDLKKCLDKLKIIIPKFHENNIRVSLFIEPDLSIINLSSILQADCIEIHTGKYSNTTSAEQDQEFDKIIKAVDLALSLGLEVDAGHGLNYHNVKKIADIKGITELNIGHSIVSKAVFIGLSEAINSMKKIIS